jgi:2-oxoglutarate ferredoxin oxidoreductase subunit delta
MPESEIIIDEANCRGCGYCEEFCSRGCIVIPRDRFASQGYLLPVFASAERCNACGVCSRMCPYFAIEVYEYVESGQAESN